jgi:hypothetical protein
MNVNGIFIQSKECSGGKIEIRDVAELVAKRISSVLQFTISDGFRPSFDALSSSECTSIGCLIEYANKKYKYDVVSWIEARLKVLTRFVVGKSVVIPTCLTEEYDELARRLVIGLLYVLRSRIAVPVILDDAMSFVINEAYSEAFGAMMRPYMFSKNRNLRSDEILMYNPIIIPPTSHGGFYRLAQPHKYTILFDTFRWAVASRDIEKIARS